MYVTLYFYEISPPSAVIQMQSTRIGIYDVVIATEAALAALSPVRGNNHPLNHTIILRQDKQPLVDANSTCISERRLKDHQHQNEQHQHS